MLKKFYLELKKNDGLIDVNAIKFVEELKTISFDINSSYYIGIYGVNLDKSIIRDYFVEDENSIRWVFICGISFTINNLDLLEASFDEYYYALFGDVKISEDSVLIKELISIKDNKCKWEDLLCNNRFVILVEKLEG